MSLRCRSTVGVERLPWGQTYPRAQRRWIRLPPADGTRPGPVKSSGERVAVIGGGITGLIAAYTLAKDPLKKVTIYEKSPKLGGWLESETLDAGDGQVVFDYGARTLRVSNHTGLSIAMTLCELGLQNEVVTQKALGRYIYLHNRLTPLGPLGTSKNRWVRQAMQLIHAYRLPNILAAILYFLLRREHLPPNAGDESVTDFHNRAFGGGQWGIDMLSAAVHGIYAGDINKLSAQVFYGRLWHLDREPSLIDRSVNGPSPITNVYEHLLLSNLGRLTDYDTLRECKELVNGPSSRTTPYEQLVLSHLYHLPEHNPLRECKAIDGTIYAFKGGMSTLIDALHSALSFASNVEIITEANVSKIRKLNSSGMVVQHNNNHRSQFDYVISTTSSEVLADQLSVDGSRALTSNVTKLLRQNNYAVNVMVVNLFYQTPSLAPRGFGYLIPHSEPNPEHGLGVIFMSDIAASQDTATGTKLTVMLGGHRWDNWKDEDLPTEEQAIFMARSMVGRHLGIKEAPILAKAKLQRNSIPQPTVGHVERMRELHSAIMSEYEGRLKVAGAWYVGPGISSCADYGLITAGETSPIWNTTGLEGYVVTNRGRP